MIIMTETQFSEMEAAGVKLSAQLAAMWDRTLKQFVTIDLLRQRFDDIEDETADLERDITDLENYTEDLGRRVDALKEDESEATEPARYLSNTSWGSPTSLHSTPPPPPEPVRQLSIRSRSITYYGPFNCHNCGMSICQTAFESGGNAFNYPEGLIYPNTRWYPHVCDPHRFRWTSRDFAVK